MNKVFLIADTHFGHRNIITYCGRPFTDTDHMNEVIIRNWNSVVDADDKVYHLGDVAMGRPGLRVAARLNGRKILIKGNHDNCDLKEYTAIFDDVRASHELGRVILTHFPLHECQKARYTNNIHGHLHEKKVLMPNGQVDPWYISVSAELINYTPILFDELMKGK